MLQFPTDPRGRVRIPEDSPAFDGHFPGHPVLPAVAQIGLVMDRLEHLRGRPGTLRSLAGLRFRGAIRPGDLLELALDGEGRRWRFTLRRDGEVLTSGRLELAE